MNPIERLAWVADVAADKLLSAGALRIAMVLPRWIGKEGTCFPSVSTIGKAAGLHERNARRCLRELEERVWLDTDHSSGRASNNYRPTRPTDTRVEPGQPQPGSEPVNPDKNRIQPGQEMAPTRATVGRLTVEHGEHEVETMVGDRIRFLQTWVKTRCKDPAQTADNQAALEGMLQTFGPKVLGEAAQKACMANRGKRVWASSLHNFLPDPSAADSSNHPADIPPDSVRVRAHQIVAARGLDWCRTALDIPSLPNENALLATLNGRSAAAALVAADERATA